MKKNTDIYGEICEIFYYNMDYFDVGIVLSHNDNKISYIDFNIYGEYNGYVYQGHKAIEEICYDDRYVRFMKKVINKESIPKLNISSKEEFINYAIKNNKVLSIFYAKKGTVDLDYLRIKVIDFKEDYLFYQRYNNYAKLYKPIRKTKLNQILTIMVDTKYGRLIEKTRNE